MIDFRKLLCLKLVQYHKNKMWHCVLLKFDNSGGGMQCGQSGEGTQTHTHTNHLKLRCNVILVKPMHV